tara:strand:- start:126 stop:521 length:396 start_codon:yes stop_codon:yes gene_type:complete
MKKIDKQMESVYEEVIELLYKDCKSKFSVVQYLMVTYEISRSRSYEIVIESKEYFGKFIMETDSQSLNECIEVLKSNRMKAADLDDLKEVRECTKEIAKLQQLYIQKIEVSQTVWRADFGGDIDIDLNDID